MIITHNIPWDKCLSHQIWPAIDKGWKDEDKPIHFFWGLAGKNIGDIKRCIEADEEWWYVDVGYLTEQITRYPEPIINNFDKTYFRIVKGGLHTIRGHVGNGSRLSELANKGIDTKFKGWNTTDNKDDKHILVCPSSPTVTYHINGMTQQEWINEITEELKKHTKRKIVVRNKPRPGNQWWNTDIKDELKNAHCLVTNMSLAAVDAVMNYVPAIAHGKNIASPITSRDLKYVERPFKPGKKTMEEWLKFVVDNQFTLNEIENGTAYNLLKEQQNGLKQL
tara:strand:+ start:565 stop:1401 length:837 start_codon:yes stop_codon:yes gene_type:complete